MSVCKKIYDLLVIILSKIIPINNKLILFESADYGENAAELYNQMLKKGIWEKYRAIWIVENPKEQESVHPEIKFISKKNILYLLYYRFAAAYTFFCHLFVGTRNKKGQVRVFLTHGQSLKNTTGCYVDYSGNTADIISISEFAADLRCKSLGCSRDSVKILGFPRDDVLIRDNDVKVKLHIPKGEKLILWMPTFRHNHGVCQNDEDFELLNNEEQLVALNEVLLSNRCTMVVKYHPHQDMRYVRKLRYSNLYSMLNIDFLKLGVEIYELMAASDALITDFSSTYIDYLLCDKPIAFDITGIDNFTQGFAVENPEQYMPGNKIANTSQLMKFLSDVAEGRDSYQQERRHMCDLMHLYQDGKATERILQYYGFEEQGNITNEKI